MGIDYVGQLLVSATSKETMTTAQEQIRDLLRIRHRLQDWQDDDFNIRNQTDIATAASATTGIMTKLLASIAGVSLVVGGIGIMNIMLVSVQERTREIGLRMSIGARRRDILTQFLIESIMLSLIGGLIGIGMGVLATSLISRIAGWKVLVTGYKCRDFVCLCGRGRNVFRILPGPEGGHFEPDRSSAVRIVGKRGQTGRPAGRVARISIPYLIVS